MKKETKVEKKQWQKPELIVLTRSKPEEAVLGVCKSGQSNAPGARVLGTRRLNVCRWGTVPSVATAPAPSA